MPKAQYVLEKLLFLHVLKHVKGLTGSHHDLPIVVAFLF